MWCHTIAFAAQTAKDWADPNGKIQDDILLNIKRVTDDKFSKSAYDQKLPLLFGNQADLFTRSEAGFQKSVLLALEGLAALRNTSFHFTGRGGFVAALKRDLLKRDFKEQREQIDAITADVVGAEPITIPNAAVPPYPGPDKERLGPRPLRPAFTVARQARGA